jgi:hypothetical protein
MSDRAINTLVRKAAEFTGLSVRRRHNGFVMMDLHGTITEPLTLADVLSLAADSAATCSPIIF